MKFGKTIKIFLIDGDPNGRMSCELSNWTGKAYKIPRIKIKDCSDRSDLTSTGVYLLFGKNENGKDQVYIGEAESILKRLGQHLTQKDFWHETIVFISKDENLNKAHIKYIENRLHDIAKNANRYSIENSIIPTKSSISESDTAEMEEFIENIKMLVATLGHKVFEDKREFKPAQKQDVFYLKGIGGADAQGEPTSDGFVVFKGSKVRSEDTNSLSNSFIKLKQKLINDNILIKNKDTFEFPEDYIFSSPSTAAAIIMGRNANGLTEWKLSNGMTLKDFEIK
ncbi:GIY-YIG nuclease family protein [Flavobacterium psychrophilum]|uniref:GIY-YIG nuclease family protein n=1 Tax=Flavobacterium psychrophilum TaxID=96345 RepID=A0A7U2NGF3_FLAPS|nr:GIY-YIG nuclease family protein [Flavobacterium psychrophilum]EKT3958065.1 GIY-YIG nuclease family protein [Flavobacterium psychrophilum]EKT3962989.1 GIY-YIG nuclease family protein [Flavobacterium psychrophilum]EKT4498617.1 GIY-YIG nuclease family protein [Flavobacterium psychrophilum]EKT4509800.1 GIY-YIG nuclease family protein [Flavobacterium psychrophilum]EKT4516322.1 GIY-YIG nuclease family protein [Flavobacterium psychrophilum]